MPRHTKVYSKRYKRSWLIAGAIICLVLIGFLFLIYIDRKTPTWIGQEVEDVKDGVLIIWVDPDGPFRFLGSYLTDRNYVRAVNGTAINSVADYYEALAVPIGTVVQLEIWRDSEKISENYSVPTTLAPNAIALFHEGVLLKNNGDLRRAESLLGNSLSALETTSEDEQMLRGFYIVRVHEELGDVAHLDKRYDEAADHYLRALEMIRSTNVNGTSILTILAERDEGLVLSSRLWRKLGDAQFASRNIDEAWRSYAFTLDDLEVYGYPQSVIEMGNEITEQIESSGVHRAAIDLRLGQAHFLLSQFSKAAERFRLVTELNGSESLEFAGEAYAKLAAIDYLIGDQSSLLQDVKKAEELLGGSDASARQIVVSQVAIYLTVQRLKASKEMLFESNPYRASLYRIALADLDKDGETEYVVAAGTLDLFGEGAMYVFDWHPDKLVSTTIVDLNFGFNDLYIQDINQNGDLDVVSLWRMSSSGAELEPIVFSYNGSSAQMFDLGGGYHQGGIQIKDMDADGTDEILLWSSLWTDDCHWCAHPYEIQIYEWDGRTYNLARKIAISEKLSPSDVSGSVASLTGLPNDLERNLLVESMRSELARLKNQGLITTDFIIKLIDRSELFIRESRFLVAEDCALIALEAVSSLPLSEKSLYEIMVLELLSRSRILAGNFEEARPAVYSALHIVETLLEEEKDQDVREFLLNEQLGLYTLAGIIATETDLLESYRIYSRTNLLAQQIGSPERISISTSNLANTLLLLGDLAQAEKLYEEALVLDEQLDRDLGRLHNLWGLGFIHYANNEYALAVEMFEAALGVAFDRTLSDDIATSLRELGRTQYQLKLYEDSWTTLNKALLIASPQEIEIFNGLIYVYLGDVLAARGDLVQARMYFQKTIDMNENRISFSPFGSYWRAHYGLARIAEDDATKFEHLKMAIDILEEERAQLTATAFSMSVFDDRDRIEVFEKIVEILQEEGQHELAFEYVERARARALLDQLGNANISSQVDDDSSLIASERSLWLEIRNLNHQLNVALSQPVGEDRSVEISRIAKDLELKREEYANLLDLIQVEHSDYASFVAVQPINLVNIQKWLEAERPKDTIISYFVSNDAVSIFVVGRNSFCGKRVEVSRDKLLQTVDYLIIQMKPTTLVKDAWKGPAGQLSDWLLEPITECLSKVDLDEPAHLTIIPSDILHYIPFGILPSPNSTNDMLTDYVLSYSPSSSSLPYMSDTVINSNSSILAAAYSGGPTAPYLMNAANEAERVAAFFDTEAYLGEYATETNLKTVANNADVIHIAAHGELNSQTPLFSAILLKEDVENDGRLEVHEVLNLDMHSVSLVVLSACQTHLGKFSRGDDVIGLERAFLYAGVSSLVTSLWSIDDNSTTFLFGEFYDHLQQGLPPSEAMRAAQMEAREIYENPFYWAGLIVVGR